jgi:hypothetical protein
MNLRFIRRKASANNKSAGLRALNGLKLLLCSGALLSMAAAAQASPFYVGASGGYSALSGTHDETGSIAGRLVLGLEVHESEPVIWGVELGVQSGSDVRLDGSEANIGTYGLPIEAKLKPLADILITAKTESDPEQPWSVFGKVGAALRQLSLSNRSSSDDSITRFAPEVQLGVGYQVSKKATLVLYYQGIYAESNAGIGLNNGNVEIDHIPMQNGGFLGVEYKL